MIIRTITFCTLIFVMLFAKVYAESGLIRFCIDGEFETIRTRSVQALETDKLAKKIAGKLKKEFEVTWINVPLRGGISKSVKQAFKNNTCDAYFGIPVEANMIEDLSKSGTRITSPYLSVGYVAVTEKNADHKQENEASDQLSFGASSASPADLFLLHNQLKRTAYSSHDDLLLALRNKELDVALVWSPSLDPAETDLESRQDLIQPMKFFEPLIWNLSIAINPESKLTIDEVNHALQLINQDGNLPVQLTDRSLIDYEFK